VKVIIVFFIIFSISPVYAKMYKCIVEGQVSYQGAPCQQEGSEFKKKKDISNEQQKAATARLNADLATSAENRRLAKEYFDKERLIQAEENNAYANYQSAKQAKRQADALEERNDIEERLDNRNRVYISPYYNRYSTPRRHPEHRPRPEHLPSHEHRPRPTPYPEKTLSIRIKDKMK